MGTLMERFANIKENILFYIPKDSSQSYIQFYVKYQNIVKHNNGHVKKRLVFSELVCNFSAFFYLLLWTGVTLSFFHASRKIPSTEKNLKISFKNLVIDFPLN